MIKWLRSDLKDFAAYHSPERPYTVKLDANESPYGLPAQVKKAMAEWLEQDSLRLYPDTDCVELRGGLARLWNVRPENVVCGVGSDQIIDMITKAFLEPGDVVTVPGPTFSMYAIAAKLNHGVVREFALGEGFSLDAGEYIAFAKECGAKIVFLCSPNNPTGGSVSHEDMERIAAGLDCVVVLDEAYGEFAGASFIPRLGGYPNVIVLRTFSKAFGAAGARVGYAVAGAEAVAALNLVKPPYNVNAFSQRLAVEILRHYEDYTENIQNIVLYTEDLRVRLSAIDGLNIYKSDANFLYVESAEPIVSRLAGEGILVRGLGPGTPERLRISAGTPKQNAIVCGAIARLLKEKA